MLSSCRPTTIQCTSSGPSAKRRWRTSWYISASGVHCEMPVAPCIWIAWSMTLQARSGTMALTMLTQTRASRLPSTSIAFAAFSTISRIASISQRACAMICRFPPRCAIFLPKAVAGESALHHQVERLLGLADRAHAVMDAARAEAHLRDLEAAALAEQHVLLRHPNVVEAQMHVAARRMVVPEHVHRTRGSRRRGCPSAPGSATAACSAAASGLVFTITIMILQRGSPSAGDVIFLAVDHPFVADELCTWSKCSWHPTRRHWARSSHRRSGFRH